MKQRTAAVVAARVVHFAHSVSHHGAADASARLSESRQATRATWRHAGAEVVESDSFSVIALFDDPQSALAAALAASQARFSVGIDLGDCWTTDREAYGEPCDRAGKLAHSGRPGEVAATTEVMDALGSPDGIGVFRAPEGREATLGHPVHLIRDYR